MNHCMVDLETMGTRAGAAIVSIGAVQFDPGTDQLGKTFYRVVDLQSCLSNGLRVEGATVMWWLQQSPEARQALMRDPMNVNVALADFGKYFREQNLKFVWGHGAAFDPPILETVYKASKIETPWDYWDVRDTRTLFDLASVRVNHSKGVQHNALDDAIAQAYAVIEAYKRLKTRQV